MSRDGGALALSPEDIVAAKASAAASAVALIEPGMLVGLGTGSTAALAIEALAQRAAAGLNIRCVATSLASDALARQRGLDVIAFDDVAAVDLAIDGADKVDPQLRAIKGAGGAFLREKIVARAAARMICIVDSTKRVAALGKRPVPVEVLPFARSFVGRAIAQLGGSAVLRDGMSDQGNIILDCQWQVLSDLAGLDRQLSDVPGLVGHGLFLSEIDELHVGGSSGVEIVKRA
ncbi:ribose-5-phosphate isomerase RpiA [Sphingobium sp. CR28]|uniref:ribose-5-phosphate isomerase RpiA n=1 Tax=Sphingobium sp. CR28 TaxID=3400272 RepID=UPI003FEDB348